MAYGSMEFYSECLKRIVSFRIILPNEENKKEEKLKLLILLHGYNGSSADWMLNGSAYEAANENDFCIILPNGENSFYLDGEATGRKYATFIGEELPEYVRKTFPVTEKREETFIGGFSMGGFGALHTALQFNHTFGKVFALSSALIANEVKEMRQGSGNEMANYEYYRLMFGCPEELEQSENNPEELVRRILREGTVMPDIFMACGTEDFLLKENREFAAFLREKGVKLCYYESAGEHNFIFWNEYLKLAAKWLTEEV